MAKRKKSKTTSVFIVVVNLLIAIKLIEVIEINSQMNAEKFMLMLWA